MFVVQHTGVTMAMCQPVAISGGEKYAVLCEAICGRKPVLQGDRCCATRDGRGSYHFLHC